MPISRNSGCDAICLTRCGNEGSGMIEAQASGLAKTEVIVIEDGLGEADVELVPAERELVFTINGALEARFSCAPHRVRSLVAGWLAGEGIITGHGDVIAVEYDYRADRVDILLSDECQARLLERVPFGPIPVLGDAPVNRKADSTLELNPDAVAVLADKFRKLFLSLKSADRMCYLAAIASPTEILSYGEGFHRINAMYRAMGEPIINGIDLEGKLALMNYGPSRAMIARLARCGVPAVVCFAPPTTGAIELANECYLSIVMAGGGTVLRIYSTPWRLV